jgi:F-type H+-transporting ATPase subunit a
MAGLGGLHCDGSLWHWAGMSLCSTTLVQTWIVMGVLMALGLIAAATARVDVPRGLQNGFEVIMGFIAGFLDAASPDEIPARQRFLFAFLTTLFLFILFCNIFDVIPPYIAPTNTLNTTGALAIIVFLFVHFSGLARHGLRYGRKFLHMPGLMGYIMLIFAVVEELSKPLTLAFRLFGNIFAGELLIQILLHLIPWQRWYYYAGGFIPHVGWLLFSVFVAVVQAFIFMILTRSYVSQALASEDHGGEAHGEGAVQAQG